MNSSMTHLKLSKPLRNLLQYLLVVSFCYAGLGLMGVTTSHSGALLGGATETTKIFFGEHRHQRSDEFLRGSPRVIAYLRDIDKESLTPFDYTGSTEYRNQQESFLSKLNVFLTPIHEILINKLAKALPIEMGFAFLWWLNVWVLFVFLPVWFFLIGLRSYLGALFSLAIFFSPTNNWFSYLPTFLFAQAAMACCLLIIALKLFSRGSWHGKLAGLVCGVYAGRLAFTVIQYPPWGIPILVTTGTVTLLFLFRNRTNRVHMFNFFAIILSGTIAVVTIYIFNKNLYSAALETVYPGQRREAGGNGDQGLWSGGIAWFFQSNFARQANFANPEVIMGPTFILIPTLFLFFQKHLSVELSRWIKNAISAGLAVCLLLLCWSQFHWPDWALKFNPLVFIPSARADQILGVLVLLPLFLLLATAGSIQVKAGTALLLTALTVGVASRDMQSTQLAFLTGSDSAVLSYSILLVAVITFSLLKFQHVMLKILPLLVFLFFSSAAVNPLVRGLGALKNSNAASRIVEMGKATPDGRWATSSFYQDALMISTGVAQLSGQQPFGPNIEFWKKLDTQNQFENNWNRGQSYVTFAWDPREDLVIWNPSGDVIQVVTNPCRPALQDLGLRWVTSAEPLGYSCLKEQAEVQWMGAPMYIYEVLNSQIFTE
jgi:hypothetical protein